MNTPGWEAGASYGQDAGSVSTLFGNLGLEKTMSFASATNTGNCYGCYIDCRKVSGTTLATIYSSTGWLSTFYANDILNQAGLISQTFTLYDIAYWNDYLVVSCAESPNELILLDTSTINFNSDSGGSGLMNLFYTKSTLSPPESTEGIMSGAILATVVTKSATASI